MTFIWPGLLLLLALVPITVGVYVWALRRRRTSGVRYSSLSLVHAARPGLGAPATPPAVRAVRGGPRGAGLRGRPAGRDRRRPDQPDDDRPGHGRVGQHVLGRHRSRTDSSPPRIAAAAFIEHQGPSTQIGIVAFSGFAQIVQTPTNDKAALDQRAPEPDDRAPDGVGQRHPGRHRRDRGGGPGDPAEHRGGPTRRRAAAGHARRIRARTSSSP